MKANSKLQLKSFPSLNTNTLTNSEKKHTGRPKGSKNKEKQGNY